MKIKKSDEPFTNLLTQGMVIKDGAKMSKSKGNVVDPEDLIANTARTRCDSSACLPLHRKGIWTGLPKESKGLTAFSTGSGISCTSTRHRKGSLATGPENETSRSIRRITHKTIKKVTEDIDTRFHFNTAVAAIMEMTNELARVTPQEADHSPDISAALIDAVATVVVLLSPFVPHVAEELWETLGAKTGHDSAQMADL